MRLALLLLLALPLLSQDYYEIQVYPAGTVEPRRTMIESHTNFIIQGTKEVVDGVRPSHHAWHQTIEITHGFSSWFETALYVFTAADARYGWQWVGHHLRPRVRIPEKWGWPVGVSLSTEVGYQRRAYTSNPWTWEIRPIVDQKAGRWYWSLNPNLERGITGANSGRFEFSPNFKVGYDITRKITGGFEYYGSLGPVGSFDPLREQQQQILPTIDLNLSPDWEVNFGVGVGVTRGSEHLLVKVIIGRRFGP